MRKGIEMRGAGGGWEIWLDLKPAVIAAAEPTKGK